MKKTFDINLLGHGVSVSSDADDEHVAKVVALVNSKASETISSVGERVPQVIVALLTALNIADEYVAFMDGKSISEHELHARAKQLISLIESV